MHKPGVERKLRWRGPVARHVRAAAQRVLYPLDRLSYAVYSILCGGRLDAEPIELESQIQRVLILAPHQDDELLGCGGFIVKYAGDRSIHIAFVTDGKGGSHKSLEAQQAMAELRKKEAREVCRALRVNEPIFLDFEDGKVRSQQRLPAALAELIRNLKPDLIMAPFITDGHPDHVATSMALAGVEDSLLDDRQICLYQVHSHIPNRMLNRYLELTRHQHEAKERALRLYVSQGMTRNLTLAKYLLFSKAAPQVRKRPGVVSIEHFAVMRGATFRALARLWNVDKLVSRITSIDYSPYSFRLFLRNNEILNTQPVPAQADRTVRAE